MKPDITVAPLAAPSPRSTAPAGSLGEAFTRLGPRLRRLAGRGIDADLAGKVGASDIVQDTFYEAERDFHAYRGRTPGELQGWLERILLNRLAAVPRRYRAAAKRRVGREVSLGGAGATSAGSRPIEPAAATTASPLSRVALAERVEALRRALAGLSPEEVRVIRWRQEDRLTFAEVGARLGISEEAARKRWARALARLEAILGATDESR